MDNEEITIVNDGHNRLTVEFGRWKNARIAWYAPGLTIYTRGAFPVALYAAACNVAVNECLVRNIPAIALRKVSPDVHRSLDKKQENKRTLPLGFAGTGDAEGSKENP